jgi:hypothetical protein
MNSRNKGNVAEREVAALIQDWWQQIEPGCLFCRTPSSGGWQGPQLREAFKASGDLMCTAERFPFAVEVKRREGWCWRNVERGMPSPVWGWLAQAKTAADEMGKQPMLWFRKSREGWRVMMPERMIAGLLEGGIGGKDYVVIKMWNPMELIRVRPVLHPVVLSADAMLRLRPDCFLR